MDNIKDKKLGKLLKRLFSTLDIGNKINIYDYSSIISLQDFSKYLKFLNLKNFIIELKVDNSIQLPFPFIAQTTKNEFHLVLSSNNDSFLVYNPISNIEFHIPKDSFQLLFGKRLLLLEKTESIYSNNRNTLNKARIHLFGILIFALSALVSILLQQKYWLVSMCLVNGFGLFLALSYYKNELGIRNRVFDIVCDTKSSCFNPENHKVIIPFSFLSTLYFSLNLCLNFIFLLSITNLSHLYYLILASIGVFFSVVSLLFQHLHLKSFCKICLFISGLAVLNFLLAISHSSWALEEITYTSVINLVVLVLLLVLMTYKSRSMLRIISDFYLMKNKTISIWTNRGIIEKNLYEYDKPIVLPNKTLELGNAKASQRLLLVLNPDCRLCIGALWHIGNLILMNDDIRLNLVVKYTDSLYNNLMMSQIVSACKENDFLKCYSNFKAWKNQVHLNSTIQVNSYLEPLASNNKFFADNLISSFPILLVGDKVLPSFIEFEHFKVAYS